ncbi:MAG: penicillin-binding protein 1A, partial [Pontibacterium sp.]
MHSLSFIDDQEYNDAINTPVVARYHTADIEIEANYIAEMVRGELSKQFDDLYTGGYRVYTTIDSRLQEAANTALTSGLLRYTERHGYKGAESTIELSTLSSPETKEKALKALSAIGDIEQAIVLSVSDKSAIVMRQSGEEATIQWDGMSWARPYKSVNSMGSKPKTATEILTAGDIVRIQKRPLKKDQTSSEETATEDEHWVLTQIPEVQGALISANPKDGAIRSLVGGFNYHHNKFNRVTQAVRQPGSNIKPFVYAAALAKGMTPATTINDAPVVFHDNNLESNWRPENYSKKFYGPTRLREALYRSRNLVSIRLLQQLGINDTVSYLGNFGFDTEKLPRNLSLSLGAADMTPFDVLKGYATLANDGHPIEPFFISRIENAFGEPIYTHQPATVCDGCVYVAEGEPVPIELSGKEITNLPIAKRTIDKQTMFLITNMMQDVITRGTGKRALALKRTDLAGKTGTTNEAKDAWFVGF